MENIFADLTPKTENHNPAAGNGRAVLRDVYFRIEVPFYTHTLGYSKPEDAQKGEANTRKFFTEIVAILEADGWTLTNKNYNSEQSHACPQLKKGLQRLYCHPQHLSGEIESDNIQAIENLLANATTFHHYKTDNYRDIIVCTSHEDEKELYKEYYDGTIADILRTGTTTPRRNLYKNRATVEHWATEKIRINTIIADTGDKYGTNAIWQYVSEHIDRLIAEGWIKTGTGRDNIALIRWANKAEEKQLTAAA